MKRFSEGHGESRSMSPKAGGEIPRHSLTGTVGGWQDEKSARQWVRRIPKPLVRVLKGEVLEASRPQRIVVWC